MKAAVRQNESKNIKERILDEREMQLAMFAVEAMRPKSVKMRHLLDRIQRNEKYVNIISFAAYTWQENVAHIKKMREIRRRRRTLRRSTQATTIHGEVHKEKEAALKRFQKIAYQVRLFIRVFRNLRSYAIENGGHGCLCSGAMQMKDAVVDGEAKDLLFDANDYVTKHQLTLPKWAREFCQQQPQYRQEEQKNHFVNLLRQLKTFRKYSRKMLQSLVGIVRYERFGRRRVVIRKGQVGLSFYVIFSGCVGVVVDGDEDKAFEKEETPENVVMSKGDSFGELALVRASTRAATIVCLENTELLVIDKSDFYDNGINLLAEEEMQYRYTFLKSMELFSHWDDSVLRAVAHGGRNLDFLSDRVIELETDRSEFVYIVTKGSFSVLRLLDISKLQYMRERRKPMRKIVTPYRPPKYKLNGASNVTLPVYNISPTPPVSTPSRKTSANKRRSSQRVSAQSSSDTLSVSSGENQPRASSTSIALSQQSSNISSRKSMARSNLSSEFFGPVNRWHKYLKKVAAKSPEKKFGSFVIEALRQRGASKDLGLGAFIKINTVYKGESFGLKGVLPEDDQDIDCNRKFILLSAGCELIRLQKSVLRKHAAEKTLEQIKDTHNYVYLTDDQLYQKFRNQSDWRNFREELVEDIALYKHKIGRSMKDRSASIPKLPTIERTCTSRAESPSKQWDKLCNEGIIRKQMSADGRMQYEQASTVSSISSDESINHAPFVQHRLVTAKGSNRKLVLTHGGNRANRLVKSPNNLLLSTATVSL